MKQPELAKIFPQYQTKAYLPGCIYFYNVINSADLDYISKLIKHAQNLRFGDERPWKENNDIEITEKWLKELYESAFYSSK
jgi:hypothetical protein